MDRELLDRNIEPVRWQIAHSFAQWTARAATQSQGTRDRFPNKQKEINGYLGTVEFDSLFDMSLGTIEKDEFNEWHVAQVNNLMNCHPNINVGWAAKMIAVYLKTTCYLAGFGRDGLDTVIHPPFDNKLMRNMGEYAHQSLVDSIESLKDVDADLYEIAFRNLDGFLSARREDMSTRIKDVDEDFYWQVLIVTCESVAEQLGCTLFEVEQLWTTE